MSIIALVFLIEKPNFSNAYNNYNIARENNPFNEKYAKAINNLSQILTIEGDRLYRVKEYDSALSKYLEAVEYSPEYGDPYFRIAKLNYAMKKYDDAKLWAEKTLAINKSLASNGLEGKTTLKPGIWAYHECKACEC